MAKSSRPRRLVRVVILIAVVAVLIAAAIYGYRSRRDRKSPNELLGNGTVEATEVDVSAKVSGKITSLLVDEGDRVRQGQLIAVLDSQDLEALVEQTRGMLEAAKAQLAELHAGTRAEDIRAARARYQVALHARQQAGAQYDLVHAGPREEDIEQLRAGVQQAQAALSLAEADLARVQSLFAQGAVAKQQVDQVRTNRDTAAAQLESARQRLLEAERGSRPEEKRAAAAALQQAEAQVKAGEAALDLALAGPRQQTIAAAEAAVAQAEAQVKAAEIQLGYTRVAAPFDGTVTVKSAELGELVMPGTPIVLLRPLGQVWLRVYVPEPELGRVKLGQSAEVTSDTYPGNRYPGRVTQISQEAEFTPKNVQTREERVKLVFGVKIAVDNPNHELKPGMPADAVIHAPR
jgi:multidrug resistance efflux pump